MVVLAERTKKKKNNVDLYTSSEQFSGFSILYPVFNRFRRSFDIDAFVAFRAQHSHIKLL